MKFFYLRWCRHIHHLLFALEMWFFLWLFGLDDVLNPTSQNLPIILILLFLNYFFADLTLKWSGLKKLVDDEIEEIRKQIDQYEKEQKRKENQE